MENTTQFHTISPIVIYQTQLNYQEEIQKVFFDNFDEYGFDIDKIDREDSGTSLTGEYRGKCFIHKNKNFSPLFTQLGEHLNNFSSRLGFNKEKLNFHVTKSWYTLVDNTAELKFHNHSSSDLSFVYYVKVPEGSGDIYFMNQNFKNSNNWFPGLTTKEPFLNSYITKHLYSDLNNPHTSMFLKVPSTEGSLIIFPSDMEHGVPASITDDIRYSIAGDIKITLSEDIMDYEIGLVHPSHWSQL